MVKGYNKIDLFGKTIIQKITIQAPFEYVFPVADQACFLYIRSGGITCQLGDDHLKIPSNYSLLLNCLSINSQPTRINFSGISQVVIVTFHKDVLEKVYDKDIPFIFKPGGQVSNQSREVVKINIMIQKYIDSILFYFENPSFVNDEILVLKLKEIVLLLAQTHDAETTQVILSQLFSPLTFSFKQIIEENLFSHSSVEELASKANLSLSTFKREFRKFYKHSPASYIKNKRLERAAELLLVSKERISDIAFDCGFSDLSNFSKSFQKKYNLSPTKYRLTVKM